MLRTETHRERECYVITEAKVGTIYLQKAEDSWLPIEKARKKQGRNPPKVSGEA